MSGTEAATVREKQMQHLREQVKARAKRGDRLPEIAAWIHSNGFTPEERRRGYLLAKRHCFKAKERRLDRYLKTLRR